MKKKADGQPKKLKRLIKLKSMLLSLIPFLGILCFAIMVLLSGGGLVTGPDPPAPLVDFKEIFTIIGIILGPPVALIGIITGIIKISEYYWDRPNISVEIKNSSISVGTENKWIEKGTRVRVSLNIFANSNKPVSIRKIRLNERIGKKENIIKPKKWKAVNIAGRHSEDLVLNFFSENTVTEPKPSYELFIRYAKDKKHIEKLKS